MNLESISGTDRSRGLSQLSHLRPESGDLNFQDCDFLGAIHPAKRPRILACKRCRHRKQKCDGDGISPCTNCSRANEECEPTEPAFMKSRQKADYVKLLEKKVSLLERLVPSDAISQLQNNISYEINDQAASFSCNPEVPRTHPSDRIAQTDYNHSTASSSSQHDCSQAASNTESDSPQALSNSPSNVNKVLTTLPSLGGIRRDDRPNEGFEDRASLESYLNKLAVWPDSIPESVEEHLINIYFDNANIRWPFLLKHTFYTWHMAWKHASQEGQAQRLWQGFFVNMLLAVSLLLDPKSPSSVLSTSRNFYDQAVESYLPLVLKQSNRLLHVQAYLMMSIHAIFSPSTEQIVLTTSVAIRYCVVSQLHLIEAEPKAHDNETKVEVQMRRRAFWSSYALDRLAGGVFGLPYTLADDNITVPLFDNIDDSRLLEGSPVSDGPLIHTSVSSTLHRERCLRIQSEILNMRSRATLLSDPDSFSSWRGYILSKLENWRASLQEAADTNSTRPTDERWLQITYNLCLLFLHIPNKANVRGPAGDWALQASLQTITIFRKFQSYKTIPHPWLGLVNQFSVGITMLYCLWATPPKFRTNAYNAKSVFGATMACSNNLAIIAERWDQAKDLLDVFELLATEVPLVENPSSINNHSGRSVTRIGDETIKEIREKLPAVSSIVLNRDTLEMIEQMITEDFPGDNDAIESVTLSGGRDAQSSQVTGGIPAYFPLGSFGMDPTVSHMGNIAMDQDMEFPTNFPYYDMF